MKKNHLQSIILLTGLLLLAVACDKTETFDDRWQLDNEAQFAKIAANTEYTRLNSQSGNGYIMYKELEEGDGATPYFTDQVKVLYTGWYKNDWSQPDSYTDDKGNLIYNKIIFDSTGNRNDIPSTFSVNGVVDGFSTALQHMQVGDKWEVWIPWKLGYGKAGNNSIPGYTTLVFEIELVDIIEE
ncbi:MAG: FKBP-type peptidyl-prolyl cis-trans isomerase [Proteiniphilum sp.]|nr:FKBP-type peptidyl-prolyl cis-trans isomerase [Proteiniphilum sp.]MDD3332807.1 FKBP-type peptidyl-prolyl cis-trans isomerase [Proteiniphilum sp.]MDD3555130.1 FKBP-type peptidyl-prolyl cis-trans isomerase [Proteiniphilum sp.]MDD3979150.1 FKBP-type peptidyl-prolyl cis-trans isomerase [Proteiniphilum sp.]MDD4485719.1 FKBP-type peptidyl-prolyl cis-trans isomerase [Proteiniphilum sp.]